MKAVLQWLGYVVLGFALTLFNGFVFSNMWDWFVVPTFSLPHIGVMIATGLSYTASHAKAAIGGYTEDKTDDDEPYKRIVKGASVQAVAATLVLGFGYLIHLFV